MDLAAQRQAILDRHLAMERTRGSGWHPADAGALEREQKKELFLSERPIALLDDDRVHLVGPCAERVVSVLRAFLGGGAAGKDLIGMGDRWQALAVKRVTRALAAYTGGGLTMPTQDWNCCLSILNAMNVQVTITSVEA